MNRRVVEDLHLLKTGLEALAEAAVSGNVTVVVIDESGRSLTGDLPHLIDRMQDALARVVLREDARGKS